MKFDISILALCFLLLGAFPSIGQERPAPCGTPSGISDWLIRYQSDPGRYSRFQGTVYVPLTIHIVGESNGSGYVPIHQLMEAFCTLNRDFEPAGIQFFIAGEFNYINNSAWYAHTTFGPGDDMMEASNVPNTLNAYIVDDPAGNCGYASSLGAAVAISCLFPDDHTWAHEMGHMLFLPHPFVGWEGFEHNYALPAPAFINDRPVEKVDGSNCHIAGDRFCGTPPDYLNFRWSCNEDSESIQLQTDPNGVAFRSDGALIMSYSNDECAHRFSDDQIGAMQASLQDFWSGLAFGSNLPGDIPEAPANLIAPVGGAAVPDYTEVTLSWAPVDNATHYVVEISRLPDIPFVTAREIVAANSLTINSLQANKDYYWRVRPFNARYSCTAFSSVGHFTTDVVSAATQPELLASLEVHPNPLASGQSLRVAIHARQSFAAGISLLSAAGVRVMSWGRHQLQAGEQFIELPAEGLPAGLYLLLVETPAGRVTKKVVAGAF